MWGSSTDNENPIRAYSEADPTIGNDSMYVRTDFTSQCDDSNDFPSSCGGLALEDLVGVINT